MKFALYLGCTVPVRNQNYEMSARKICKYFGIELVDIPDFTCCGFPIKSVNQDTALAMSARNLALAEKQGLNIMTLCTACTGTLVEANHLLKHNEQKREEINKILKEENLEYNGTIEVKHFARILYEDIGIKKIKENIKKPLSMLKFAGHPGCHFYKPSEAFAPFDNPENPHSYDELLEATGAKALHYEEEELCCGGAILGVRQDIAYNMAKKKLESVKKVNADALILICPFCDVMYEQNQKAIEKEFEIELKVPVLYYSQILGLALGMDEKELGIKMNRIKPKEMLEKLNNKELNV